MENKENNASSNDDSDGEESITLTGCGQITEWKFPKVKHLFRIR